MLRQIKFYNSLTNQKEDFTPITAGKVSIYNCGVTVYDRCHLGHARGAVNFDVLRRFLESQELEVTYIKNYTDIDDKMIDRAKGREITVGELATEMIALHDRDMESLGINAPTLAPKATDHIAEMISMIEQLIAKGHAYEAGGDVFFKVDSYSNYGKLSGKNIEDLIAGQRVDVQETKENPLDFVLWKSAKPNEPKWESPWGEGRPGWHIECSAMSLKHLGANFDIHAGGSDLIFPHHENEIAQSCCASGESYANYWLHNGMIKIESQKMSKSLGNFATIEDLVQIYNPELIRFFILSSQYRKSIDFSHDALKVASEGLDKIYQALKRGSETFGEAIANTNSDEFFDALADDLNTAQAISVLFDLAKSLNIETGQKRGQKLLGRLVSLGAILGLLQQNPEKWFNEPRIKEEGQETIDPTLIESLIAERVTARETKNWARADEIRDQFAQMGVILEDKDGKTTWKRK